jgi:hypothetical protein
MAVQDLHADPQSSLIFDGDIRHSDWFYMKKFLADFHRDMAATDRHLLKIIGNWLTAYDMLKTYEDVLIIDGNPNQLERDYFRASLAIIKGHGIHLLSIIENQPFNIPREMGVKVGDIAAMVEELAATEQAFSGKTPLARTQLLQGVFGAHQATG